MRLKQASFVALLVATAGAVSVYAARALPRRGTGAASGAGSRLAKLNQTVVPSEPRVALRLPTLTSADGGAFGPEHFRGRWTLAFFGYTSCPDVCPNTL